MKIEELRVYDPARDGLDYTTYQEIKAELAKRSSEPIAAMFEEALFKKVLDCRVAGRATLSDFLYGPLGYFENSKADRVVFNQGLFLGAYSSETAPNLEDIAQRNNSIPFAFIRPVEMD